MRSAFFWFDGLTSVTHNHIQNHQLQLQFFYEDIICVLCRGTLEVLQQSIFEMELTLNVDENGRTASASAYEQKNLPIDYSTKALMFDNFNEDLRKQLIHDCEASIAPELPMTFWLSMNDKPRCMLEKMAKKIFNTHVKDKSGLDPKSCGCEWWVQVRPSEGKRINSNSSEAMNVFNFIGIKMKHYEM